MTSSQDPKDLSGELHSSPSVVLDGAKEGWFFDLMGRYVEDPDKSKLPELIVVENITNEKPVFQLCNDFMNHLEQMRITLFLNFVSVPSEAMEEALAQSGCKHLDTISDL